jgi:asparagine synthetase A
MENIVERIKTNGNLKRARRIALVLGIFLVITLISMVYALVQQTEAKRQEKLATQLQEEVLKLRIRVVQAQKLAEEQMQLASKSAEEAFAQKLAVDVVNNQLQRALKDASMQKRIAEENYKKAKKIK